MFKPTDKLSVTRVSFLTAMGAVSHTVKAIDNNALGDNSLIDPVLREQMFTLLFREWALRLCQIEKSPHTLKNWFSDLRKRGEDLLSHEVSQTETGHSVMVAFLKSFKLNDDLLFHVTGRASERMGERAVQVITLPTQFALDFIKEVEGYAEGDAIQRLIFVLAMTGRRPVECREGNFESWDDSSMLVFNGQAKGRKGETTKPYPIPYLCEDVDSVFKAIKGLNYSISATACREQFARLAEETKWPVDKIDLSAKALRAFYACYTYFSRAPDCMQEWHWVNDVLGHEDGDTETCQTYMRFRFTDDPN